MDHLAELKELRSGMRRAQERERALTDRNAAMLARLRLVLTVVSEEHPEWAKKHPTIQESYRSLHWSLEEFAGERPATAERPVAELELYGLDQRTLNALDDWHFYLIGDLLKTTQEWLLRIPNFGKATLARVHTALREAGYLGKDEELPHEAEDKP